MGLLTKFKDIFSRLDKADIPSVETEAQQPSTPQEAPQPKPKRPHKPYLAEVKEIELMELQYTPITKQIIYVESEYNKEVNSFIQEHYLEICKLFEVHDYEFCYLPYIVKQINDNLAYYAPQQREIGDICAASKYLLKQTSEPIEPSLLYYDSNLRSCDSPYFPICKLIKIDLSQDVSCDFAEILQAIELDILNSQRRQYDISHRVSEGVCSECEMGEYYAAPPVRYSIPSDFDDCDYSFLGDIIKSKTPTKDYVEAEYPDEETKRLLREIEERILRLEQRGVGKHILQQIISSPSIVSRMIITRDYHIILPDYNNMEIEMTPLVKAVYILFLHHPEGIVFKQLYDYREELISIYQQIKGERLNLKMKRSISNITDPTNNSINEKVARIREAFVTRFDERLATNYIIHGERGEAKRIPLHRELVEWQ